MTFAQALAADLTGERLARNVRRLRFALRLPGVIALTMLIITGAAALI